MALFFLGTIADVEHLLALVFVLIADRSLRVSMKNANSVPLTELRWQVGAYAPGDTVNLAENTYSTPRYRGPGDLQPGAEWNDCLPLPPLRQQAPKPPPF